MSMSYTQLQGLSSLWAQPASRPGVMFGAMRPPGAHRWLPTLQGELSAPGWDPLCAVHKQVQGRLRGGQGQSLNRLQPCPPPAVLLSLIPIKRGRRRKERQEEETTTTYFSLLSLFRDVILPWALKIKFKKKLKKLKKKSHLSLGKEGHMYNM